MRMAGGKPTKALRPKRRWIGIEVDPALTTRKEVESAVESIAPCKHWRLYDFKEGKAILRVRLAAYPAWREALVGPALTSVTASGKIRLVRERMGLPKPPVRR